MACGRGTLLEVILSGAPHPVTVDTPGEVEFREIDVARHAEECIRFRADSFTCSFGAPDRFFEEAGPGCRKYLEGLSAKNRDLPGSCAHVWLGGRIVGQVEMKRDPLDTRRGHVLLYYLVPELRGTGLGESLDAYVVSLLRRAGMVAAWLRVSPANERALRYYRKHGWIDRGPDPLHPIVHLMEKELVGPAAAEGGA